MTVAVAYCAALSVARRLRLPSVWNRFVRRRPVVLRVISSFSSSSACSTIACTPRRRRCRPPLFPAATSRRHRRRRRRRRVTLSCVATARCSRPTPTGSDATAASSLRTRSRVTPTRRPRLRPSCRCPSLSSNGSDALRRRRADPPFRFSTSANVL